MSHLKLICEIEGRIETYRRKAHHNCLWFRSLKALQIVLASALPLVSTFGVVFRWGTAAAFLLLDVLLAPAQQSLGTFTLYSLPPFQAPVLPAAPRAITVGPDGALWFTESYGAKIGRITTSGQIIEYPITTQDPNQNNELPGITAGSDGALWFTEPGKIGRITTTGEITEYKVSSNSGLWGIVSGPDGALWFTDSTDGAIGRITTTGVVTKYPVPVSYYGPNYITVGPDGALWFTDGDGKIGRITTAGAVTEYSIPTSSGVAWGIAAGPDGALWFLETSADKIGRITTSGAVTEYKVPGSNNVLMGIAAGADGALWYTEQLSGIIGRITTAGVITQYKVPGGFPSPWNITSGPDGALWFTDPDSAVGRIGSITTGVSPPSPVQTGTITIKSNLSNATFLLTPSVAGAPPGGPYPVTLPNVPVGQYSITFSDVQGYVTPSSLQQTLTARGTITFDGEYSSVSPPPFLQTIFLIHGIGQDASGMAGLASSLQDEKYGVDRSRFRIDAGFDFGYCANIATANVASCSNDCTIQNGARALALYVNQQNPTGDIVLIGYSMGGLIARDMILNNYANVITNHHVSALITLGTPNLGYPYDPRDSVVMCGNLVGQMFGDFRNPAAAAPPLPAVAGQPSDFTDANGSRVALSGYLYGLNMAWLAGGFVGPDIWFAGAGEYSTIPVRAVNGRGCPTRNGFSDSVVCADSAAPAFGIGPGLPWPWFGPQYSHTGGLLDALATLFILGDPLGLAGSDPLFNPPTQGDLVAELRKLINGLPVSSANAQQLKRPSWATK